MHPIFVTKFQKSPSAGAFRLQRPLTFNIGDLSFYDLAKLWFFKLLWQNRT